MENNVLTRHQHGFTEKSCQSYLLEAFEQWTGTIDEGLGLDILYLHHQKAFDNVPHKRHLQQNWAFMAFRAAFSIWSEIFCSSDKSQLDPMSQNSIL